MSSPILSIGIIFRNDIRCIERCLKALEPLRKAVACELVMADTGSTDGSRQIAEQYADVLFDFPWVDDFSAARNAVMNKASGRWFLTVDTDEYLDPDFSELRRLLRRSKDAQDSYLVTVRNYTDTAMDNYMDFQALRLVRMSSGARYVGAIHEHFDGPKGKALTCGTPLTRTVFHHDGYVGLMSAEKADKRKRNMALLRKKIEEEPENLMGWLQVIESGLLEDDIWVLIHQAVSLVEEKKPFWQQLGPPIYRYAVHVASQQSLPETEEWIERAWETFPDSLYTKIDVGYLAVSYYMNRKDYANTIKYGEIYLEGIEDYRAGKGLEVLRYSTLSASAQIPELNLRMGLATAYDQEHRLANVPGVQMGLEFTRMNEAQVAQQMKLLLKAHARTTVDTAPVLVAFWKGISMSKPSVKHAKERKQMFLRVVAAAFTRKEYEAEQELIDFCRPGCTLFAPLEGEHEVGRAAGIMAAEDPAVMTEKLSQVERWNSFPIYALAWALEQGAAFPTPQTPLTRETMNDLARRLAKDADLIVPLASKLAERLPENRQALAWIQEVVQAAVGVCGWQELQMVVAGAENDAVQRMQQKLDLAWAFARVEGAFLPRCYTAEILEDPFVLPPLHRLGWRCAQAFRALERGDAARYVHLLRKGLEVCPGMKGMINFLLSNTPQLQEPSQELQMLAEQLRMALARFAPNDPAVALLKQSEAYRKVAHIIEGTPAVAWGGQLQ